MLRAGAGAWTPRTERLLDDNYDPVWVEHPERFAKNPDAWWIKDIDVVALKVTAVDDLVGLHALSLTPSEDVELAPGAPVSVIGFPFGLTGSDMFPIWKTGHLASDPYADSFEREHLIDITTRQGMSGSPAVHRYWRVDHDGVARPRTGFFGIYSGRVREDSELGIVWRAHLVEEILAKGVRGNVKT